MYKDPMGDRLKVFELFGTGPRVTPYTPMCVRLDGRAFHTFTRNLDHLPDVLEALPEVEKVTDLPKKVNRICPGQKICPGLGKNSGPPSRRLLVTMRKRSAYLEG